jgi:hypothetical protein
MNGGPTKKTSPWVYVAIGCGGALLLALLGLAGVGLFGYRKVKQLEAELKDPNARAAKVAGVLGGEIPPGYYPVMALSVPFLMDMALLGDQPPDAQGAPAKRMEKGFVYVKSLAMGQQADELKSYFEGKTDDAEVLRRSNIHVNAEELIRRGVLEIPGQSTLYLAQRGDVSMGQTRTQGLTTMLLIDCPQDARQRLGIWFGPDPAPGQPVADVDWSGSIADETVMRDFLSHFKLCGGA